MIADKHTHRKTDMSDTYAQRVTVKGSFMSLIHTHTHTHTHTMD